MQTLATTCCIAGGGPAGLMLGFLLARAGVAVTVLEKHQDFLRDFRGDTIHPSTLEIMHQLGLLDAFLRLPHTRIDTFTASVEGQTVELLSLKGLPVHSPFVAMMPQWDFLNFIAAQAARYPHFKLFMGVQANDLLIKDGQVCGLRAQSEQLGELEVEAALTVAADGRDSRLRALAGFAPRDIGVGIDVLWFRVPMLQNHAEQTLGRIHRGRIMVVLPRNGYFQCAWLIPKGSLEALHAAGLDSWKQAVAEVSPFMAEGLQQLQSWDEVKPLAVQINYLPRWSRPGFLCIGDAAHAMSPAGGVGVNLALQDAVAAANLLWQPLREGVLTPQHLTAVQRRRERAVRWTQRLQAAAHKRMFRSPPGQPLKLGLGARLLLKLAAPLLRPLGARLLGLGFQPERVQSPQRTG